MNFVVASAHCPWSSKVLAVRGSLLDQIWPKHGHWNHQRTNRLPSTLWEGNVFSRVCPSFHPCGGWSHVAITHDALEIIVEVPLALTPPTPRHGISLYRGSPGHGMPLYRDPPLLVASAAQHWRPIQTCSPEDPTPNPHWYWHLVAKTRDMFKLVHLRVTPTPVLISGGYWSTGLLSCFTPCVCFKLSDFIFLVFQENIYGYVRRGLRAVHRTWSTSWVLRVDRSSIKLWPTRSVCFATLSSLELPNLMVSLLHSYLLKSVYM